MAIRKPAAVDPLKPILDDLARTLGRYGVSQGEATGAKAALRIVQEENVRRVVQVYWTAFQANVPGRCVGLHLEVAEPRVHWAECYVSPTERSWYFSFAERPDGEIQLTYHEDFSTPQRALERLFALSGWYVLTATGTKWGDVVYEVDARLPWTEHREALAGTFTTAAVQESLKKSTIIWLRWSDDGTERTMPVWFVFDNKTGKIYVLSGERQQTIPGAESLKECKVVLRWKGKNAQVAELPANVRLIQPGQEWDEVAEKLAEKRLNIPGLPEDTAKRWRDQCHLLELTLRT